MNHDVFIGRVQKSVTEDAATVVDGLRKTSLLDRVLSSERIVLKPNLTYPVPKPGVTTTPYFLSAVLEALIPFGKPIYVVESDGGNHAWTADQALASHVASSYANGSHPMVHPTNLSKEKKRPVAFEVDGGHVEIEMPELLLEPGNVFITLPVPKRHVMTGVSLALKNQWGCIPDTKRLKYHSRFSSLIVGINKLLDPIAIFDGTYFLDETGPMDGRAVEKDIMVIGSAFGTSWACCEIMSVPFDSIEHHQEAVKAGLFPGAWTGSYVNEPSEKYRFSSTLKHSVSDRLAQVSFRSAFLTNLFYVSKLAKPLHDLAYAIKGRPRDFAPRW